MHVMWRRECEHARARDVEQEWKHVCLCDVEWELAHVCDALWKRGFAGLCG